MIAALPDSLIGRRDACLLLLGFSVASRRSELVALTVEDLSETADAWLSRFGLALLASAT